MCWQPWDSRAHLFRTDHKQGKTPNITKAKRHIEGRVGSRHPTTQSFYSSEHQVSWHSLTIFHNTWDLSWLTAALCLFNSCREWGLPSLCFNSQHWGSLEVWFLYPNLLLAFSVGYAGCQHILEASSLCPERIQALCGYVQLNPRLPRGLTMEY